MKFLLIVTILFLFTYFGYSQNNDNDSVKWDYSVSADLVSRYVWRGTDYGNSPAIQPTLELSYKNISAGAWGSFTFNSLPIQETDLYLSASIWKFKFTCWDYFFMNMDTVRNSYYQYSDNKTGHDFSMDMEFFLSEKIPLKILASYNFYGADTLHSSYFEASYKLNKKIPVELFVGYTPSKGWYGNGPGVVNAGIGMEKEIKISETFSLPFFCKLIFNPQKENIHLVAGMTF